jgi:hypothetical protein
MEMT